MFARLHYLVVIGIRTTKLATVTSTTMLKKYLKKQGMSGMAGNANWHPKESNVKSKQLVVNVSKNGPQKLENIQLDLN
jgi:hypothetical protein